MPTEPKIGEDPARRDAIETGRRVLRTEADALSLFAEELDQTFADAVELILATDGRVICSGAQSRSCRDSPSFVPIPPPA